jgi:predicted  nucleic acid-binding Zn-ribbon protein
LSEQKDQLEKELQLNVEKMAQIESHKESSINELMSLNTKLLAESESLKKEINNVSKDKLELESTVDDLKRTLNLTEKESQVNKLILDS